MATEEQGLGVVLHHRQFVEASVLRACGKCGAPGVYKAHESILVGWPGCHVPEGDPRIDQSVGEVCPNCGAQRPANEDLGEIWDNLNGSHALNNGAQRPGFLRTIVKIAALIFRPAFSQEEIRKWLN